MNDHYKRYFHGKKSDDLSIILNQSDSFFVLRKFGSVDSTIANVEMDAYDYAINNAANNYKYPFINTLGGINLFAVSDNVGDAGKFLTISLLDGSGVPYTVFLELNGQTPVPIIATDGNSLWTRHETTSAFSVKTNPFLGNVYIFSGTATAGIPDDPNQVYGYVSLGKNRSQQAIYTIPTTHYGFFRGVNVWIIRKQTTIALPLLRLFPPFGANTPLDLTDWPTNQAVPQLVGTLSVRSEKPDFDRDFPISEPINPGTDILFSVTADAATAGIAFDFDLIMIKKEYFGSVS